MLRWRRPSFLRLRKCRAAVELRSDAGANRGITLLVGRSPSRPTGWPGRRTAEPRRFPYASRLPFWEAFPVKCALILGITSAREPGWHVSGYHMAVVAGMIFFAVRALFALLPAFSNRHPIKKWA